MLVTSIPKPIRQMNWFKALNEGVESMRIKVQADAQGEL